jgi:hypothetical protein
MQQCGCSDLVCAQRNHWIDLRSSSCREVSSQERDSSQKNHHPSECNRIVRSSSKEKRSNETHNCKRSDNSNCDANQCEFQRFPDHIKLHGLPSPPGPCVCRSPAIRHRLRFFKATSDGRNAARTASRLARCRPGLVRWAPESESPSRHH